MGLRDGNLNVFGVQGPKDSGQVAPQLKQGAKARYRAGEHAADDRYHTSGGVQAKVPGTPNVHHRDAPVAGRVPPRGGLNDGVRHIEERGRMPSGDNPKPTKSLSGSGSSSGEKRSGMERALGSLADQKHPVKRR